MNMYIDGPNKHNPYWTIFKNVPRTLNIPSEGEVLLCLPEFSSKLD